MSHSVAESTNTAHGSGWLIQILSTETSIGLAIPPTEVGGSIQILSTETSIGLAIPPTEVGGLFMSVQRVFEVSTHCRGWD
jgi:hypothetical protein